jgi:hypothetical protein
MRKLESMIAQFVDDLLLTIGEASVEELRELFASRPEPQRTALARPATARPPSTSAAAPVEAAPPRLRPVQAARTWTDSSLAAPPPAVAEITDPESLLSLVSSNPPPVLAALASLVSLPLSAPAVASTPSSARSTSASAGSGGPGAVLLSLPTRVAVTETHIEPEGESPASGIRPVGGATVRLSDNETLARVSNAGIVIRRKKKA